MPKGSFKMEYKAINEIQVNMSGDNMSDEELSMYLKIIQNKEKSKIIEAKVSVDSEGVDVTYTVKDIPFERIRRITGYLVGTTDRWCDAKKAELRDRLAHNRQLS